MEPMDLRTQFKDGGVAARAPMASRRAEAGGEWWRSVKCGVDHGDSRRIEVPRAPARNAQLPRIRLRATARAPNGVLSRVRLAYGSFARRSATSLFPVRSVRGDHAPALVRVCAPVALEQVRTGNGVKWLTLFTFEPDSSEPPNRLNPL